MHLLQNLDKNYIIGGDFNTILNPQLDKTRAPPSGCRPLIYLSKYESNLIINKEVMAILAKLWGCGHLLHYLSKMKKSKWGGGGFLGGMVGQSFKNKIIKK